MLNREKLISSRWLTDKGKVIHGLYFKECGRKFSIIVLWAQRRIWNNMYYGTDKSGNPIRININSFCLGLRSSIQMRKQKREKYWKIRHKVISLLGGECFNCKEKDIRVLQINHKEGGGSREYWKTGNYKFYNSILKKKRNITDLDIRCANCNVLYEYERGVYNVIPP